MKKHILLATLLFVGFSLPGWADDPIADMHILIIQKTIPVTRSTVTLPEASICGSTLTVSFDGCDVCSLYIEDDSGRTVFSSTMPADGMEYSYNLSSIGKGDFTLLIVSSDGEFEGVFSIN